MKIFKICVLALAACTALNLSFPDDADARRIGGGRSFGSSSRMTRPAPAPSAPGGAAVQPGYNTNRQATNPGAAGGGATLSRPFSSRGLLGGLLAGSLIGSLLMGTGFAGGGMLDILLIAALVYFGMRFLRGRSAAPRPQDQNTQYSQTVRSGTGASSYDANSAWDRLRGNSQATSPLGNRQAESKQAAAGQAQQVQRGSAASRANESGSINYATAWEGLNSAKVTPGFDQEEFLRGAKLAYVRLQESWDKRDIADIAEFATPAVMEVLQEQLEQDPTPSETELLLINASFFDFETDNGMERASVFFDVLMREDQSQDETEQVREIWHFVRSAGTSWKLDGIQQVH